MVRSGDNGKIRFLRPQRRPNRDKIHLRTIKRRQCYEGIPNLHRRLPFASSTNATVAYCTASLIQTSAACES